MCISDGHGYHAGQEYGIMHNGDFPHRYNRIGQYAFTKQKNGKQIEHFEYNHLCSGELITAKINELVDAVNELMKKSINE